MNKKKYDGLVVRYVFIGGTDIVAKSTKPCEVTSVQYYVGQFGPTKCDPEGDPNNPIDDDYSYNWNNEPHWD